MAYLGGEGAGVGGAGCIGGSLVGGRGAKPRHERRQLGQRPEIDAAVGGESGKGVVGGGRGCQSNQQGRAVAFEQGSHGLETEADGGVRWRCQDRAGGLAVPGGEWGAGGGGRGTPVP
eukprot:scaffold6143_cov100-Isochrysis_galbana.AAC.1